MKKLFTTLFVLGTLMGNAQNVVNYGMLGNPTNLVSKFRICSFLSGFKFWTYGW